MLRPSRRAVVIAASFSLAFVLDGLSGPGLDLNVLVEVGLSGAVNLL